MADEFYSPRADAQVAHWKVTARFTVHDVNKNIIPCVRLRLGIGPSYYMTTALLEKNFKKVKR